MAILSPSNVGDIFVCNFLRPTLRRCCIDLSSCIYIEGRVAVQLVSNTTLLVSLGLLKSPNEKCSHEGKMKITGEFWHKVSVSFSPGYQLTSSRLLVVWGLMLLFASWPFRRILIAGTLSQVRLGTLFSP